MTTIRVKKTVVTKIVRKRKLTPVVLKNLPSLPAIEGIIVLDRNNELHAAWMADEEGEEELN